MSILLFRPNSPAGSLDGGHGRPDEIFQSRVGRCQTGAGASGREIFSAPVARPRVARPARAFTLLELMLAIAIFSLVMAAIYSSWMLILRATKVRPGGRGPGPAPARRGADD